MAGASIFLEKILEAKLFCARMQNLWWNRQLVTARCDHSHARRVDLRGLLRFRLRQRQRSLAEHEQPGDNRVRDSDLVHVAPLQLAEEYLRIHRTNLLALIFGRE